MSFDYSASATPRTTFFRRYGVFLLSIMLVVSVLHDIARPTIIPLMVVMVATLSMLIAVIKMPILLAYEHWNYNLNDIGKNFVWCMSVAFAPALLVGLMLTFFTEPYLGLSLKARLLYPFLYLWPAFIVALGLSAFSIALGPVLRLLGLVR